jgi:hypothetical protein
MPRLRENNTRSHGEGFDLTPTGEKKWQHFERLVAAIHRVANDGADVRWNDKIGGRQFDVTIRFRHGLYEYLTVVECKDYSHSVPVEKVEAFVTKAGDAQAHYSVMASTSGFQEGAERVAREHNMTLIHVTETSDVDLSAFGIKWGAPGDVFHIERVELEYADGEKTALPDQSNALRYYMGHIRLQFGSERGTLDDLVENRYATLLEGATREYRDQTIVVPEGTQVIEPDDGEIPLKALAAVHLRAAITTGQPIIGPNLIDPYLLIPDVKVRNVATGEENTFRQHGLRLGHNNAFEKGKFYEQPQLASYYYCMDITGNLADIWLVESFQHGKLLRAKMTVETKHADLYLPVSDGKIVERLKRRLEDMKTLR